MSMKTLRKRLALVAVSALGAGLLSVIATPVANAAAADVTPESLWIATTNSATGSPVLTAAGGDTALDKSVGYLARANAVGTVQGIGLGVLAGVTSTHVVLPTAKIAFNMDSAARIGVTITGGTISSVTTEDGATAALVGGNGNVIVTSAAGKAVGFSVTVNPGATRVTLTATQGAAVTSVATAGNGTAVGVHILNVSATDASAAFSASDSPVAITTSATAAQITTSVDAATTGVTAGNPLFIQVIGNNAYSLALTSGTYVASATNGATVAWGNAAAATAAGTLSTATVTPDGTDQLRIDPASSLTTSTTVVTITHNGNPVTTKTLTFYGEAKSIKIESVGSGRNGTSIAGNDATAYAIYSYRDSDGNKVPGGGAAFAALSATGVVSTGSSIRSPSRSVQAAAAGAMDNAVEALIGAGTDGIFGFTCLTSSATTTVTIAHTNAISLATLTAPVTVACNGGLGTYTVSTDKASYKVGEIATLTIDAKDTSGNPVSDNTVIAAGSVSIGGGSLVQTIAGTEVFTAGKRTLKAQMTTAGTFNAVVTLDGAVTKSATTGYTVTDGAVSNAEVLSAIVKLIASINDQIALLQKQLRKANRR